MLFGFQKMIPVPYFFFLVGSLVVRRMGTGKGYAALLQFGSNVVGVLVFRKVVDLSDFAPVEIKVHIVPPVRVPDASGRHAAVFFTDHARPCPPLNPVGSVHGT